MPKNESERPLTPEELRWRAATRDPEKARHNLKRQYILVGFLSAMAVVWGILLAFGEGGFSWGIVGGLLLSYVSLIVGIVNNKRIQKGRKPWGDNI